MFLGWGVLEKRSFDMFDYMGWGFGGGSWTKTTQNNQTLSSGQVYVHPNRKNLAPRLKGQTEEDKWQPVVTKLRFSERICASHMLCCPRDARDPQKPCRNQHQRWPGLSP